MNKFYFTIIFIVINLYCYSQQTINNVVGSSGDTFTNSTLDLNINQTTGELIIETINNSDVTLTQGFQQTYNIFYIEPKAILQGAFINSPNDLMRDDLRTGNYLPTNSPYNTKIEISNNALDISNDNAIVDWIEIELRDLNNNTVAKKSALLQRDGNLVSADGISPIQFTTQNDSYYVLLNHRNHFGAMSANPINLRNAPVTSYDFTSNNFLAYGNNAMVELTTNKMALWAGNAFNDNRIRYQGSNNDTNYIKDAVLAHPDNISNSNLFSYFDYDNRDINLDGRIRYQGSNNDSNFIKDVILLHPDNVSNSNIFSFFQQIPND